VEGVNYFSEVMRVGSSGPDNLSSSLLLYHHLGASVMGDLNIQTIALLIER
jgi:hypothetical protein